jgi:hypothetical protein
MIRQADRVRGRRLLVAVLLAVITSQPGQAKSVRIKPAKVPAAHSDAPKWKPAYVSSSGKLIPGHFVARHPKS